MVTDLTFIVRIKEKVEELLFKFSLLHAFIENIWNIEINIFLKIKNI